jgi:hypothetical protein
MSELRRRQNSKGKFRRAFSPGPDRHVFLAGRSYTRRCPELSVRNGDPILILGDESDVWIGDLSFPHRILPIVHVDRPFVALRSAVGLRRRAYHFLRNAAAIFSRIHRSPTQISHNAIRNPMTSSRKPISFQKDLPPPGIYDGACAIVKSNPSPCIGNPPCV